ncbi:MAG: AMP-binding protein [Candidatus Hodarchaeales archaeon]|jgi:fatty-acyl-CoA synthase
MVNQFDYLSKRNVFSPDNEAIIDVTSGTRYTYEKFNQQANKIANYFQNDLDFQKRDRVAVLAQNTLEYWEVFFGTQKSGGILVGLNWRLVARELAELITDTSPRVIFFDKKMIDVIQKLKQIVSIEKWICFDEIEKEPEYHNYVSITNNSPHDPPKEVRLTYKDPLGIVFTGGTTGFPKGAMITYQHVAYNTLNTIRDILPGDTYINHLPLFHIGGIFVYALPLFILGGKVIQMKTWDVEKYLELMSKEKPNFGFCVPTQYRMLMTSPNFNSANFNSVRFLTSGGEPLSLEIIRTFKETHNVSFKQGFGMTEVGPGCFALDPKDAERKMGSIGTPNFFIDAKVVNSESGAECQLGEIGELVLKGPTVTIGYWNRPKLNETLLDNNGYFHTGDLVRKDEEGYFFVVDRVKDMFISGGENVYPREIEKVLEENPKVAQVQVIGIPHPKWGQCGRAIIVLKEGKVASEDELVDFCRNKLASFKIPKSVVFIESFNQYISGAGKLLKRSLQNDYS